MKCYDRVDSAKPVEVFSPPYNHRCSLSISPTFRAIPCGGQELPHVPWFASDGIRLGWFDRPSIFAIVRVAAITNRRRRRSTLKCVCSAAGGPNLIEIYLLVEIFLLTSNFQFGKGTASFTNGCKRWNSQFDMRRMNKTIQIEWKKVIGAYLRLCHLSGRRTYILLCEINKQHMLSLDK